MKLRLVLSLGLSIGAVGVEPGLIRTANETGEITLVCSHDALVGEHLVRARRDVEQLTGAGVVVQRCPHKCEDQCVLARNIFFRLATQIGNKDCVM